MEHEVHSAQGPVRAGVGEPFAKASGAKEFALALAEMQVLAANEVLSRGKPVFALDSTESTGWSKTLLTDGITEFRAAQ